MARRGILVLVVAFLAASFFQSRDLANLKDVLNEMLTFEVPGKGSKCVSAHFWMRGDGFVVGHE